MKKEDIVKAEARNKFFKYFQPNAKDKNDRECDCVIRALCKGLDKEWVDIFDELYAICRKFQLMMDGKKCYEKYLKLYGFEYQSLSIARGDSRPTVNKFCETHRKGTYILRVAHHLVTVVDGKFYDTWDSGDKCLYGFWKKL